jgi:hypothetical protein
MGTLQTVSNLNALRKGVKNLPNNKWFVLASLLGGTKYGGRINRLLGVYGRIRAIIFLLSLAGVIMLGLLLLGVIYLLSRIGN